MKRIHYDRYSLQAEKFMALLIRSCLIQPTDGFYAIGICRYTADSVGAALFENVYLALVKLVFGEMGIGMEVMSKAMERDDPVCHAARQL